MNECANARFKVCHMFAFVSGVCYLGRTDVSNGTVANKPSNVTIYSINGKWRTKNKAQSIFYRLPPPWWIFYVLGSCHISQV